MPLLFHAMFPSWFAGFAYAGIAIGALVPAAVMSIGAANTFTRNIWKPFVDPAIAPKEEAQLAKLMSLVVKVGALHRHLARCRRSSRSTCNCSAACGWCRSSPP